MEPICFKVPRLKEETVRVEFWDLPHFYEPVHFHEECQITYVMEGRGMILVGAKLADFKEGDLFFIGKNQPHVLRHDEAYYTRSSRLHARAISIFFSQDTINRVLENIPEANRLSKLVEQSRFGIRVCRKEVHNILPDLKAIHREKGMFLIIRFVKILDSISKCQNLEQMTSSLPYMAGLGDNMKLNKVFNYLMENYNRRIFLEEVSSLVNMTPNAFCRFFKIRTNKIFTSFLIEIRINQACKMLSDGNHNVTETYFACGYNNSSNFHRHFRAQTGYTPTGYLARLQR